MKTTYLFLPVLLLVALSGCCERRQDGKSAPDMVGADRDAHGCIPSAGYSWCKKEAACVRPWELAQTKGFDNTPEALHRYCD